MKLQRGSGILLHPTSLPGPHGSGDIGRSAHDFLDWLAKSGQRYWQFLPLSPTGFGDSPYSALSAFAANPLLIALDDLVERGWLPLRSAAEAPSFPPGRVDFQPVGEYRWRMLRHAAGSFFARAAPEDRASFDDYCQRHVSWLADYSLFMALNSRFQGREWSSWDAPLARRDSEALAAARRELQEEVRFHEFTQWAFSLQWKKLREAATARGIRLIGDMPIFVAFQSADVWAHPDMFYLDQDLRPTVVSGVPPDYFSETGQRWGNPLYRWDRLAENGYQWWVDRFRSVFDQVDIARVDHFRGFAGYWEIPAAEKTAVKGQWVPGPGPKLFEAVRAAIGSQVPIIAEDLGVITPDVIALRDQFELPGMRVLQFAFGSGPTNTFLPHNYQSRTIVYTGTHDNDTTIGWFGTAPEPLKDHVRRYVATDGRDIPWDLIKLASSSVADVAIFPLQDVIGLGTEGRMNRPGEASGNWGWRFTWDMIPATATLRLNDLTTLYGRAPAP